MIRPVALVLPILLAALLAACGQKQVVVHKSAAIEGAERLERRAAAAFAKGDSLGAAKDYQTAAHVYESLAMQDELAVTQLNLARIESEAGRKPHALALVEDVLRKANAGAGFKPSTLLIANGRAAALAIGNQNWPAANSYLDMAQNLCQSTCDATSALLVLRAEVLLASANQASALASSNQALALAVNPADKANALRMRAQVALGANNASSAMTDANAALQIDQELGASSRVIADLALLVRAHGAAGDAAKVAQYKELEQKAQKARDLLHAK
jgi:tetratricopeptide (TPR) repeat protein